MFENFYNLPKEIAKIISCAQDSLPLEPVPIRALAADLGITVTRAPELTTETAGYIRKSPENNYEIFYNPVNTLPRQRFIAAHLLAHCLLHGEDLPEYYDENIFLRGGLPNRAERAASRLAGEILIPMAAVNSYTAPRKFLSLTKMAEHFGVTLQFMAQRLGVPLSL